MGVGLDGGDRLAMEDLLRTHGLALAPDGRELILGQRSPDGAERLLRIVLDCRPD